VTCWRLSREDVKHNSGTKPVLSKTYVMHVLLCMCSVFAGWYIVGSDQDVYVMNNMRCSSVGQRDNGDRVGVTNLHFYQNVRNIGSFLHTNMLFVFSMSCHMKRAENQRKTKTRSRF